MSRIDDLIQKRCPNGVEFKRLGDLVRIRNGKDHKALGEGHVPVYGSGGVMRYADTFAYDKPSVLIPRKGSLGNLFYVDTPFWTVDTIFYTEIDEAQLVPKFLYYFLTTVGLGSMNQAGGVPSQTQTVLNALRIPVPSLEIQIEIVRLLDTFSKLEAELEAELEARQTQYTFYRDQLLNFGSDEIRWARMNEIFAMRAGQHLSSSAISDEQTEKSPFPVYGGNGLRGYGSAFSHNGHYLLIGRQGALCGNVKRTSGKFYATEHAVVTEPNEDMDVDFAFYLLTAMNLNRFKSNGAQPGLAVGKLGEIMIPIPPLSIQQRAATLLGKFDSLVNDISSGLPAELNARRQQYEHYRDRLLTFKEAV